MAKELLNLLMRYQSQTQCRSIPELQTNWGYTERIILPSSSYNDFVKHSFWKL